MTSESKNNGSSVIRDWDTLGKNEGLVLRGAGILLIMLHNFYHWVPPVTGENEFHFESYHFASVLEQLGEMPLDACRILFSYFGHYGVQLFVFLSAYGLTRSFTAHQPTYRSFLRKRLLALYPAIFVAGVFYLVYNSLVAGMGNTQASVVPLLRQIFLISNFTGDGFTPIGPWWFLSMICQFYLVFPLLFCGLMRFGGKFLILLGGTAIILELLFNERLTTFTEINLNYTVGGHLAEFSLGIWAASTGKMKAPIVWMMIAGTVFAVGQIHPVAWLFSGLAFIVMAVPLLRYIATVEGKPTLLLSFLGTLSLPLFLMNGFLRNPLVWQAQVQVENGTSLVWLTTLVWSLVFLLSCTVFAWLGTRIERALRSFAG